MGSHTIPYALEAHEDTHVSGGADDIDSALALAAMADLAQGKFWIGNVTNRPFAIDFPEVGAPTKEFFVPVTVGEEMTQYGTYPACRLSASGDYCAIAFRVPHDFTSIVTAEVVVICAATQAAANWDIRSMYAAIGEPWNTHDEEDDTTTYNVTDGEIEVVDIKDILTALAADDYVGIQFMIMNSAHDAYVLGVHFKYS